MTTWPVAVRKPPSERSPGKAAFRLCAAFEGLSLKAYPDPASQRARASRMKPEDRPSNWQTLPGDPWTIGYGHTKDVKEGDFCTLAQADAWLMEDLEEAAAKVRATVSVPVTAGEFDALTSMAFNLKGGVPRSMRACLNGGITDKGVQMSPGSYGSALQQFPRNCRAAGVPMRGLLRRRLAEACVYSDLPWEAACSENIVRLELDANGNPDPYATTSLEETLERARQDVPIMRPDVSDVLKAPWPKAIDQAIERAPTDGIPVQLPLPGEDELLLDTPAASESIPDTKAAAPSHPQPEVEPTAHSVPNTGSSKPASPAPVPTAPQSPPGPVSPLPPPKLPDPPIPVGQQTSAVDATRKAEDWSESAKSMIFSRRFWGLFLVVVGRLWMLKTGSNAVLGAVSDPIVTEMFSGFMVMMLGEVVQRIGERKATRPLK